MNKCCGRDVDTPFCAMCGKRLEFGNVAILREMIRNMLSRAASAEKMATKRERQTDNEYALKLGVSCRKTAKNCLEKAAALEWSLDAAIAKMEGETT